MEHDLGVCTRSEGFKLRVYNTLACSELISTFRAILLLMALVLITACTNVPSNTNQSKPFVKLSGSLFADLTNNRLISRYEGSHRSFVRLCDGFVIENELSRVEVNYDCQLDEAVRAIIRHSIESYHESIMFELSASELYKFALKHQPNLCINFVRPQVGFKFSKSIDNCFEMYRSVNQLDMSGQEDYIHLLTSVSYFNVVKGIYPSWIHEMFHFNYSTNDLDATNNAQLPFGDRLTNEYIAQLMEIDVTRIISNLFLLEDKQNFEQITFGYVYSVMDPDTCNYEDVLARQKELKGEALSVHYSLLGYDLANYTYDNLVAERHQFPIYISNIMESLGGRDNDDFFESLLSHCSSTLNP